MTPPKKETLRDKAGWIGDIRDILNNRIGLALIVAAVGNSGLMEFEKIVGVKEIHVSKIDTVITDMNQLDKDFKAYQTLDMKQHQDLNTRIDNEDQRIGRLSRRNHLVSNNP